MNPKHTLSLDESGCLIVETDRPARVIFQYKRPGEGGIYFATPTDKENTYRLDSQFTELLKKCAAEPTVGSFSVMAQYGGFARVELPKSELIAALAGTKATG